MRRSTPATVFLLLAAGAALAQSPGTTDEIVERERIRADVAAILDEYAAPASSGDDLVERANDLFDRLAPVARDVAPYLAEELERDLRATFDFCAVALGRMDAPESGPALRRAIARADEELGDFPRSRKAMAVWALGIHGELDALDLAEAGRHLVSDFDVHHQTSVLEAVGFLTAPASVPRLLALVERALAKDDRRDEVVHPLGALRRIGDPASAPALIELLRHEDGLARREAARALGAIDDPRVAPALLGALATSDLGLRRAAAASLERLAPAEIAKAVAAHLDSEDDPLTRAPLYRCLARAQGAQSWPILRTHWDGADLGDRRALVDAIAGIAAPKATELLAGALHDPDPGVAVRAVAALGQSRSRAAVDALVQAIPDAEPILLLPITRALAELHARSAGAALADQLFALLTDGSVPAAERGARATQLVRALVDVRHTASAPRLREAATSQRDAGLARRLDSAAGLLEAVERFGQDPARWQEALTSGDRELRRLGYSRLGEIGGAAAAGLLATAFDGADREDRVELLRGLAEIASPRSADLVDRVLNSGEFDSRVDLSVREMAGWAARRIGGPAMYALLERAVERRNGRDFKVTTCAALAGGRQALGLLAAQRKGPMRYVGWERGRAQERLDRAAREIARGIPLYDLDVPPDRLALVP